MITQGRRRRPNRSAVPLSTAHRSVGTAPLMEAMRVRPKLALIMRHASGTFWARMDWDRARWGCMTREPEPSRSAGPTVIRLGEEDWRAWRAVRLAALADAPGAFGSTLEDEQALGEEAWRAMTRGAAIFVAVLPVTRSWPESSGWRPGPPRRGPCCCPAGAGPPDQRPGP